MLAITKKNLLLATAFCISTAAPTLANTVILEPQTTLELEPLKVDFNADEFLLADLFKSLDEIDDEELKNLPQTPENFKYLSFVKELCKFINQENPYGFKTVVAVLLAGTAYAGYKKPRTTAITLASTAFTIALIDFIATRRSNKIK